MYLLTHTIESYTDRLDITTTNVCLFETKPTNEQLRIALKPYSVDNDVYAFVKSGCENDYEYRRYWELKEVRMYSPAMHKSGEVL